MRLSYGYIYIYGLIEQKKIDLAADIKILNS